MATFPDKLAVGLVCGDPRRVPRLERLPIDSLWVGGHVASPNGGPEVIVGLARLSAVVERVAVGTAVLLLPLYQPAVVAKQLGDIDRATGGRLIVGVGVGGEYPGEFRACEVPMSERGARTDEAIPLLRTLWTAEPINHEGRFHAMEDVEMLPGPVRPGGPPIVVAGRKERPMRRAALLGDGWLPYLYSPRRYAASVATIRTVAADAGRDLTGFGWFAFVFVNVNPDGDRAREETARFLGGTYRQDFKEMVDHVAAAGTPAEVAAKLRAFHDAGARHFIFLPAGPVEDADAIVDRLMGEAVPALREHATNLA